MRTMSNRTCVWLLIAVLSAVVSKVVIAAVPAAAAPPDEQLVTTFLGELRRAVARDDRPAVGSLIQYPLTVLAGDLRIPIKDAAALVTSYDVVFTPALKAVIAQAAIRAPGRPAPVYPVIVGDKEVTIGDELIRVQPAGGALKITRIREPLVLRSGGGGAGGAEREPKRLNLRIGQTQLSGALTPGGRDEYIVSATKNQLVEVRINGVNGRDIVARLVDLKTREPLDARARDGARVWTGRVPEDGDYRLDIVRLAAAGEPRLPYILIISMR
jgi:hypothetical protein